MRMTDIHVERFGVWRDLHLQLPENNLSILYGPNEAGKSTLMRFVRAMLYGFPPGRPSNNVASLSGGTGTLEVEHDRRRFRIQRVDNQANRGDVIVTSLDQYPAPYNLLDLMLNGVEEEVFEKVFAVGLREIQELGTLQDGEVADRIYGLTLGPDGQKLIGSAEKFRARRAELLDAAKGDGRLASLFDRHDRLSSDLRLHDKRMRQHRELCRERARLEAEIGTQKQRHSNLQSELRGHLVMQRIHGPWKHVADCEAELSTLRTVQDFPERGIERLEKFEYDLKEATAAKLKLADNARNSRSQANKLRLPSSYRMHAGSIQGLIDQKTWIRQVQDKIAGIQLHTEPLQMELELRLEALGPGWSVKRLETFDTSPAAHFRLVNVARAFRAAVARRSKAHRIINRLDVYCNEKTTQISQGMQTHNVTSIEHGLLSTRRLLANLEHIGKFKVQHAEFQQRQISLDEERERIESRLILPPWVYFVLVLFGISGFGMLIYGLNSGLQLNQVVGAVYTLLIVTCGGICWAIKNHFETETQQRLDQVNEQTDANLRRIRETQEQTKQLITPDLLAYHSAMGQSPDGFSEAELIKKLAQRSTALEGLRRDEQALMARRQRLSDLQTQQALREREVGIARQNWQDLMSSLGFAPNSSVEQAFEAWRLVTEACEIRRRLEALLREQQQQKWIVQSYERRICEIGLRITGVEMDGNQAWDHFQSWEQLLTAHMENRPERIRLKKEAKSRMREAGEYHALTQDLKTQKAALLVQAGTTDRQEFLDRAEKAARRIALLEELTEARMQLERAMGSDRDLAITEDLLHSYDPTTTRQRVESLKQDIASIELDLQRGFEQLGSLKHEIRQLETNRDTSRLRFEREQIAAELDETLGEWVATELAGHSLLGLRGHFERTCQPVTLADASRHLERLTVGKYRNVWTPLGERQLRIDDEKQRTLSVEQLSRGTREQLFLSIRLALVEELARQGVRLPMVLDDVLVNFDQERSQAATDVLRDFASKGHQVLLFTCHRHLAEQAEAQGMQPIWLPGRESLATTERLAG